MIRIENITRSQLAQSEITKQAVLYKGEAYTFFDEGLTRYVFANKDKTKVIKILIDEDKYAKDFNQEELDIYNSASDEKKRQLAKTEMNGRIIEQEFCEPIKFNQRPLTIPQIRFAQSCRNEVGWTADGRLVCFDLSELKKY